MAILRAPGLTADWLNGWLAAVGVTVLVPGAKLRWSEDALPVAELQVPGDRSVAQLITAGLPRPEAIEELAIAKQHVRRNVPLETYRDRAAVTRRTHDFSLAASLTDLLEKLDENDLPHSPFDPPAPKGRTLHDRVGACVNAIFVSDDAPRKVGATLDGTAIRVKMNGLGFDYRRLDAPAQPNGDNFVDPVAEILAFHALALFPVRGNGGTERARGWVGPASRRHSFSWPAWSSPLDRWAIDALLDRAHAVISSRSYPEVALRRLGVTALFATVAYRTDSRSDPTRAYASERLW